MFRASLQVQQFTSLFVNKLVQNFFLKKKPVKSNKNAIKLFKLNE